MKKNTNTTTTTTAAAAATTATTTTTTPTVVTVSTQQIQAQNSMQQTTAIKKRVQLLMSVPIGQEISQPTKNALISEFLNKNKKPTTNKEQQLQQIVQENEKVTLIKPITTNIETTVATNDNKNNSIAQLNDGILNNKTLIAIQTETQTKLQPVKKRVQLLMSVPIGQEIPTPTKNALISEFLNKNKKVKVDYENVQQKSETNDDTNDNQNENANELKNNLNCNNIELNAQSATAAINDVISTVTELSTTTINAPAKKRVQLLMSVPIGQEIPATTKNALINEFLNKNKIKLHETKSENNVTNSTTTITTTNTTEKSSIKNIENLTKSTITTIDTNTTTTTQIQ